MIIRVEVKLKRGHFDPEGDVTARSLRDLNFPVRSVRVSKVYTIEMDASNEEDALRKAHEMCRRLLANPTKDDFSVEVLSSEGGDH